MSTESLCTKRQEALLPAGVLTRRVFIVIILCDGSEDPAIFKGGTASHDEYVCYDDAQYRL